MASLTLFCIPGHRHLGGHLAKVLGLCGLLAGLNSPVRAHEEAVAHVEAEVHEAEHPVTQAEASEAKWTPEQQLDAIRRALVKASLQGATKVETVSWIDENGALRDSASFRSDMRVRGVQVLGYTVNEQGEPEAKLDLPAQAASHEDLVKDKPAPSDACPKPVPGLRQVVGVDVVLSERWQSNDVSVGKSLVNWSLRALGPVDRPWVLLQRPGPAKSSYEATLLATPLDQTSWRARLTLTPLGSGKVSLPRPDAEEASTKGSMSRYENNLTAEANTVEYPSIQVKWQWQVARNASGTSLLQESGVLDVVVLKADWSPWVADPLSQPAMQKLLSPWVDKMQQALACEWLEAQITQVQGQEIRLNMGSVAGVKVGDQWLVADLPRVALHTLEPDVLTKTVLAEVKQVFPYSARLSVVAGQANGVQRHWKAWPAQALSEPESSPPPKH